MEKSGSNKNRMVVVIVGIIVFLGIGLQFTSPVIVNTTAISEIEAPSEVKAIFKRACFDCHSNQAKLQWFDKIAPFSMMVARDITEARSRFNFSDWNQNPPALQQLLLWEMVNAIEQKKMPLPRYKMVHPAGNISASELLVLKRYVNTLSGRHKIDTGKIMKPVGGLTATDCLINLKAAVSLNGIPYSDDYKSWQIISITDKYDGGSMRIVYGNNIMVKAIESGQLPFPDGAKIVKAVWGKQREDKDGNVLPGNFQNVQIMIKDSKKYQSTEGWGFAKFEGLQLKPFGKTALFANTCINCHRLLVPENDFVFNIPTK